MRDLRLFVERPEAEESLRKSLTGDELRTAEGFGSERRRREYMMWRHIVRRELGSDVCISYTESGRPIAENRENIYIGVSHSADFVAVVISPRRCAVDIERLSRDFSKVARRYVTDDERHLSDDPRLQAAIWCAKETLYKYADVRGADFLRDIRIESVDFEQGTVVGRICGGAPVDMAMLQHEENLVVYVG